MVGDLAYTAAFYLLSLVTLGAAAGVVVKRNLVHSALLLALSFIGVAGLYVLLEAEYLAAVQILVYSGAVAVMVVIGIMLTVRGEMEDSNPPSRLGWSAGIVAALFSGILILIVTATPWKQSVQGAIEDSAPVIAQLLLGEYVLAFEAAAVLLLAAMMGAIILAKGADET
ncbi:hypothetical protein P22_0836 [Propionispora sp. 2/2-37]|uniref:NADH-quinone oxidoreductase subunit J family protein n=1 Tax=Propionispora sp. 2/2-37 TaxID=1677858 RepID=UPI0006C484A3|nr:NADH-quinone oxidoreductase subunit J [Propionispora sp. 2/2-37]CUH94770.1 hypothetical protein P22_0836 [Propionispora sp. 2/2-37]